MAYVVGEMGVTCVVGEMGVAYVVGKVKILKLCSCISNKLVNLLRLPLRNFIVSFLLRMLTLTKSIKK